MLTNRSMPPGEIIPELAYADVTAAATWLCRTFGFKERLRIGNHRIQLVYRGTSLIVIEQRPGGDSEAQSAASVMVRVDDVHGHHEHVRECGAAIIMPPEDFPYGERQYAVRDIGGHRWTFSQSIADVDPHDWGGVLLE